MKNWPRFSNQWNALSHDDFGLMNIFDESIRHFETRYPNFLPDIRQGSTIFVASDYSGQHNLFDYETLTFLFADIERCRIWDELRKELRQRFLHDSRRMSYKNLNDRRRRRALFPFLAAANMIPGLVATILIDKNIKSLFWPIEEGDINETISSEHTLVLQQYAHWKKAVFEKLLRVIHFVSFFIAGLSRPYQNVIWVSDEDEIAPNEARIREVTNLFAIISSHYISHDMGHFRFGTTKLDKGTRELEDLVAVADFVAGALSQVLSSYKKDGNLPQSELIIPPPQDLPKKAKQIMNWFADDTQPLKRLVYVVKPIEETTSLSVKHMRFHGLRIL